MNIIGVLLIFLLIPFLFVLILVINLVIRILHVFHKPTQNPQNSSAYDYAYDENEDNIIAQEIKDTIEDRKERGEKIIGDDEGEYVDYEEVKD